MFGDCHKKLLYLDVP